MYIKKTISIFYVLVFIIFFSFIASASTISMQSPSNNNASIINQNFTIINATFSDNSNSSLSSFVDFDRSLVAWWRLNNESGENNTFFIDYSTFGNNATCEACPSSITDSNGLGYQFDGTNDVINMTTQSTSLSNLNEISIQIKFKQNDLKTYVLLGKYNTTMKSYTVAWDNTNQRLTGSVSSDGTNWVTTIYNINNLQNNTLYNLTYTVNSSGSYMYLNDSLIANTNGVNSIRNLPTIPVSIGGYIGNGTSNTNNAPVTIYDIKIFNRYLTNNEVNSSFDATRYYYYRNFTNLTNGEYRSVIYSENSTGNVTSMVRYVDILYEPNFFVTLTSPLNGNYFNYNFGIPLQFITNTTRSNTCKYSIDGSSNYSMSSCSNTTFTPLLDGNHNITLYISNAAGLEKENTTSFAVTGNANWSKTNIIYQTGIEYYPNKTFNDLKNEIPTLSRLGVKTIYLLPIWNHTGAIYSIRNLSEINTTYGTPQDLKDLINETHNYSMKIMLDLVTAYVPDTSDIYNNHKDWLMQDNENEVSNCDNNTVNGINILCDGDLVARNISGTIILAHFPHQDWGWAIDRSNADVITYFADFAKDYIQNYSIDGFRIDAPQNNYNATIQTAHHDSLNFFRSVKKSMLQANNDSIMLGEYPGLTCETNTNCDPLLSEMFDISYNYPFNGWLRTGSTPPTVSDYASTGDVGYRSFCNEATFTYHAGQLDDTLNKSLNSTSLFSWFNRQKNWYGTSRAIFIESFEGAHRLECGFPTQRNPLNTLLITLNGTPMIYVGQENGVITHRTITSINRTVNSTINNNYNTLFNLRNNNENLFSLGDLYNIRLAGNETIAYERSYVNDTALIIANFYNTTTNTYINATLNRTLFSNVYYILNDTINNKYYAFNGSTLNNISITLDPFSSSIILYKTINSTDIREINVTVKDVNNNSNTTSGISIIKNASTLIGRTNIGNYTNYSFENTSRIDIKIDIPTINGNTSMEIMGVSMQNNISISPIFLNNLSTFYVANTELSSSIIVLNDTELSYNNTEISITISRPEANRILHCTSWDYTNTSCNVWNSSTLQQYSAVKNNTHIVFNVTSFDAYAIGYYNIPSMSGSGGSASSSSSLDIIEVPPKNVTNSSFILPLLGNITLPSSIKKAAEFNWDLNIDKRLLFGIAFIVLLTSLFIYSNLSNKKLNKHKRKYT